ncbi:MAG: IclR family transcriptional regulator [Chloroflexota bacterium]|nr:IclR family transcriptional regulator [Chloroflexota bacterium]
MTVDTYTISVLEDAINVLELFIKEDSPLTLTEIHKASGLSKSKAFRILVTLEEHSLVQRDEAGQYLLGPRFLVYGQRVQKQMSLLTASRPVMDWLVQETTESIFLGIIDGTEALCIDVRQSPHSIRLYAEVGRRAPLYVGGVPKVLLAFLPSEERDDLLDEIELVPITSKTIVDRDTIEEILQQIREQGYVVTADDLDEGAHSIAAPIFDQHGNVIAAISMAGPSKRILEGGIARYVNLVREGAARVSHSLGYPLHHPTLQELAS